MTKTCSIEGCEKQMMCRTWCPMHYQRWRTHGDPLVVTPPAYHPRERPGRKSTQETCAVCSQSFVKVSRTHHPSKITCSTACRDVLRMWGKWVDNSVTYKTAHNRVRFARGPASRRQCSCGAAGHDWAYIGPREPGVDFPFSADVRLYEAMCQLCHRRFDAPHRLTGAAAASS